MTDGTENAPVEQNALSPLLPEDPKEIGGHRLVGRIGAGGMGVVYAAAGPDSGYIAVKVIHSDHAADPEFRVRFAREVALAQRVANPRVPTFYGADTQAASPWLATEYVPGPTLREYITAHGPLRDGMLLGFAVGVAEALRAVHVQGIVHRDLKPGNVILAQDGPRVLDFGIARAMEETALTRTGGLVGSPGWIAPEQYQEGEITSAADLFSWASLVAFAATGSNPFGSGPPNALAYRVLHGEPDLTGVPDGLLPLLTSALHRDPHQRPSAADAVRSLHSLWSGDTLAAGAPPDDAAMVTRLLHEEWTEIRTVTPPMPESPGRTKRRRRPLLIAMIAAAVVLVLGGTAGAATVWITSSDDSADGDGANSASSTTDTETDDDADEAGSDGDDDSAGDADSGDDNGDGEQDEDESGGELPTEAVDYVSTGGSAPNTGEVTETGATARMEMFYSGVFASSRMELSDVTTSGDGVQMSVRLFQDGANALAFPEINAGWFYIHGPQGEIPTTASFDYESTEGINHSETHTLTFPDAPESGLLTMRATTDDEQIGLPPFSVCYESGVGFSTDYEECA